MSKTVKSPVRGLGIALLVTMLLFSLYPAQSVSASGGNILAGLPFKYTNHAGVEKETYAITDDDETTTFGMGREDLGGETWTARVSLDPVYVGSFSTVVPDTAKNFQIRFYFEGKRVHTIATRNTNTSGEIKEVYHVGIKADEVELFVQSYTSTRDDQGMQLADFKLYQPSDLRLTLDKGLLSGVTPDGRPDLTKATDMNTATYDWPSSSKKFEWTFETPKRVTHYLGDVGGNDYSFRFYFTDDTFHTMPRSDFGRLIEFEEPLEGVIRVVASGYGAYSEDMYEINIWGLEGEPIPPDQDGDSGFEEDDDPDKSKNRTLSINRGVNSYTENTILNNYGKPKKVQVRDILPWGYTDNSL